MKNKTFQKQDLARAALHDGCIKAWDTGLGKGLAAFEYPLVKLGFTRVDDPLPPERLLPGFTPLPRRIQPGGTVLMIVPGDLHQQMATEGQKHFHCDITPLDSQETFQRLIGRDGKLPPGFYITSYSQLSTNGVLRPPDPFSPKINPRELLERWGLAALKTPNPKSQTPTEEKKRKADSSPAEFFLNRETHFEDHYRRLQFSPKATIADLDQRIAAARMTAERIEDGKMRGSILAQLEESYAALSNLCTYKTDPSFDALNHGQQDFVIRHFLDAWITEGMKGDGEVRELKLPAPEGTEPPAGPPIKCLYCPSLADLCWNAFDCVVIDEGVRMKGTDTYVGQAVRSLKPKYRLVLTATPVKNRLRDIFWLAWWAAGGHAETNARWPYTDQSSEVERFAGEFMVSERNLTREAKAKAEAAIAAGGIRWTRGGSVRHVGGKKKSKGGRYTKLTAEVCNIHRLWKLLGPIVLRRRKQDAGEDIVPKIRKVVRCEMGRHQKLVYRYHLEAEYLDKNARDAVCARLQALRTAAADPASDHLIDKPGGAGMACVPCKGKGWLNAERGTRNAESDVPHSALRTPRFAVAHRTDAPQKCEHCRGTGHIPLPHRSPTSYTPKMATTLQLVQEILARGEQVVVFSAFNDPLDVLAARLREAEVRHCLLDGRTSQKRRGNLADIFKRGRYQISNLKSEISNAHASVPVMLAGVECMAEGHSFHLANNVILIAYSWAYDKFIQAINRVHRMTSPRPVNVYVVIANGTIDRKLEALIGEKGDAAELVLDGQLMGERTEEVNLAELLRIAREEFDAQDNTIDEARLELDWPNLRDSLRQSQQQWDTGAPILDLGGTSSTSPRSQSTKKKSMKNKPRFDTSKVNLTPKPPRFDTSLLDKPKAPEPAKLETRNSKLETVPDRLARLRRRAAELKKFQTADVWSEL